MWIYAFIRQDISIAQQIVQTAHSAYESGRASNIGFPRLVLIGVRNGSELKKALEKFKDQLDCYPFYETEQELEEQLTSFTTRPVTKDERKIFKDYKLWRESK